MGFDAIFPRATHDAPILLDGGLGTTLEDMFHINITHPLWSARLVDKEEDIIIATHLAFLRAGSQVILASTYQAAYETFRRAGYGDSDAERLMCKSVELAVKARETYETLPGSPRNGHRVRAKIALSLGPYGATLETAAEFTGTYPPPYGPSLCTSSSSSSPEPRRGTVPASEEESYADALAVFHFTRLLVYARAAHVWDTIDLLAFETVPLVTEAKAIRVAVARLEDWFRETTLASKMKPWYISFVFPGPRGEFPQYCPVASTFKESQQVGVDRTSDERPYTPYEVAQAVSSPGNEGQRKMATPNAIGVNCTKGRLISPIIEGFASAVRDIRPKPTERFQDAPPWLALYPNGGVTYDPVGRTWIETSLRTPSSHDKVEGSEGERWAKTLVDTVLTNHPACSVFGGLLVGGCCKTGPDDIKALKEALTVPPWSLA